MTNTAFPNRVRLGTRGSPLALAQAREVADRLSEAYPGLTAEIVEVKTTGDVILDRPLSEVGGKGLFSKELDQALRDGRCDAAVHSMKDLETWLPPDIEIACVLEREDPRDAFISLRAQTLDDLPSGARVGTASLRRQAQVLAKRPDLQVVTFRGNVNTRLRKLEAGEADATLLAMAGLNRLGMSEHAGQPLPPDVMLPAAAQGAVAVAVMRERDDLADCFSVLHCDQTAIRVTCERAFLEALDGSCRTPIGALAEFSEDDKNLSFRGLVAREDGSQILNTEATAPADDAYSLGFEAGKRLKTEAGDGFFE